MCLKRLFRRCCRELKLKEDPFYVRGFLKRPTGTEPSPNIPLNQDLIHNPEIVSIVCLELGEICMGLGYIAELLRFPPDETRGYWTLSYAVWDDNSTSRLLWRKFFANVTAFFYIIDARDRKLIHLAKKEIDEFIGMNRPMEFPEFLVLIFLNNSTDPKGMKATEVEEILGIDHPKCLGYLIQPMRGHRSGSFRAAVDWLDDQLDKNAHKTLGLYPNQIARERSRADVTPRSYPTFDLKTPKDWDDEVRKHGAPGNSQLRSLPPITTTAVREDGSSSRIQSVDDGKYVTFNVKPKY